MPAGSVDFTGAVEQLAGLGITVRSSTALPPATAAEWSDTEQAVTLRADTTLWVAQYVLRDLYDLHVTPGHLSPSTAFPCLRVVS